MATTAGVRNIGSGPPNGWQRWICIPSQPPATADGSEAGGTRLLRDRSGRPLRILIVEDDPAVASVFEDMVTDSGGEPVGIITSALAAIGAAAVIAPDVVLMDVRLQGSMDGLEATEVIRARNSAAVVVITGAGADPQVRPRLATLDGVEIVFKPVLDPELCGAILRAHELRRR